MALTWESSYAVAKELSRVHSEVALDEVTLRQIYVWTLELPGFEDEPALCNDGILSAIFQEWVEETLHA